eukprot:1598131-Rhodomonas_salina.5
MYTAPDPQRDPLCSIPRLPPLFAQIDYLSSTAYRGPCDPTEQRSGLIFLSSDPTYGGLIRPNGGPILQPGGRNRRNEVESCLSKVESCVNLSNPNLLSNPTYCRSKSTCTTAISWSGCPRNPLGAPHAMSAPRTASHARRPIAARST